MKKLIVFLLFCLFLELVGCNDATIEEENSQQSRQLSMPEVSLAFKSLQEFQDFIESTDGNENLTYQCSLTMKSLEGYSLSAINYRNSIYIASHYAKDNYQNNPSYDEYENERLSTAIYEVFLFPDAQESLRLNYMDNDYEPIVIGKKTYYYMPEYAANGNLIGHELAFIANDNLMFVHLPAAFTMEDLAQDSSILSVGE
jgi:hypothetical protein